MEIGRSEWVREIGRSCAAF